MILYALSTMLFFVWFTFVDVERTLGFNSPNWVFSDWVYLAGLALTFSMVVTGVHFYHGSHFFLVTFANICLGSEIEDCLYGEIVHNDPLFPFADWFAGWGFNTKDERITFDLIRIGLAIIFFLCSRLIASI